MNNTMRKKSNFEEVLESKILIGLLCGYSLRTCTLYLIWVDLLFLFTFSVLMIIVNSFFGVHVHIRRNINETQYSFFFEDEEILSVNVYKWITDDKEIKFSQVGKQIFAMILSWAVVDFLVSTLGLVAVYHDAHKWLIPYIMLSLNTAIGLTFFLVFEVFFIALRFIQVVWWFIIIIIAIWLHKTYKLLVIYSYYHMHRTYEKGHMKPAYLTTESPILLPTASIPLPRRMPNRFQKNVQSIKPSEVVANK